jgi:dihydropteroate synthase
VGGQANLGGCGVGEGFPVRIVGAINVSPESFYQGSVARNEDALRRLAHQMVAEGADILDIGAMSTAPYLETAISEEEERRRLCWAVETVRQIVAVPLSADTTRGAVASAALEAGATILNDVNGLRGDPAMALAAAKNAQGLILMAAEESPGAYEPLATVSRLLTRSLRIAREAGIPEGRIVLDPGIGFFRRAALSWERWDCEVLRRLREVAALGCPLLVGVSRKSFIGKILNRPDPADRLAGSLAAVAVAVLHGASAVRTHDVAATCDAVRMAEALRDEI